MRRSLRVVVTAAIALVFAIIALADYDWALPLTLALYTGITIVFLIVLPFTIDFTEESLSTLIFELGFVQVLQTVVMFFKTSTTGVAALLAYTLLYVILYIDYI